jgi:hypothetical protein
LRARSHCCLTETGFFFGHGTNAHTLFDIETTLAQNTVIHHPGLLLAGLKVQIAGIDELALQRIEVSAELIDPHFTRLENFSTYCF